MALLGGMLLADTIRGKVAGNVFSKARNGATLRRRNSGRNPRSANQSAVRAALTDASRAARSLGIAARPVWVDYANSLTFHNPVSGGAYNPSWFTAYTQLAVPFLQMGGTPATIPDEPPTEPFETPVVTVEAAGGVGTITFTGSAAQPAGTKTALMVQRLKSEMRAINPNGYTIVSWGTLPATPFEIDVEDLTPGTYAVAYKFGLVATGQESPVVELGIVTVT